MTSTPRRNAAALMLEITLLQANELSMRASGLCVASSSALLLVQVIYKITTPFTVGSLENPVVISNLVVAALHLLTLSLIVRELRQSH